MPVLKNPRHERFAQLLASGKTATDAHEKVGFKRSRFNASHLAARPGIGARIQQITTVAAMLGVMRDPTEPAERRDEMAKAAPHCNTESGSSLDSLPRDWNQFPYFRFLGIRFQNLNRD